MKPVADQTRRRCEVSHIRMRDQWSNAAAATTMNRESPGPDRSAPDAEVDPTGSLPGAIRADARRDGLAYLSGLAAGRGGTGDRHDRDGPQTDRGQTGPNQRPPAVSTAPNPLYATQCGSPRRRVSEWRQPVKAPGPRPRRPPAAPSAAAGGGRRRMPLGDREAPLGGGRSRARRRELTWTASAPPPRGSRPGARPPAR